LADLNGAARARVVPKPQVWNAAQLQRVADTRAEKAARLLEPFLDRHGVVVEAERIEVHRREAQIAGDLDVADASPREPRVFDLPGQALVEGFLDLRSVGTLSRCFARHRLTWRPISARSYPPI